ncbi:MAG TPA: DNA-processing protein DprA, partial [Candidatus Omnitrophota bacterium]|nr:DNA-processing protein DprA [Candidatus Omnitrophota bacterium]
MKYSEFEALLILNAVDIFGSIRIKKILKFFGSAKAALEAGPAELNSCGVFTPVMMQRFEAAKKNFIPAREIEEAKRLGVKIISLSDKEYPELLKEIYDPPVVLYVKGSFESCDINSIGVVGSRGASYYGLSCAKEFSSVLSRCGITIVSGMARGVDTSAHRAALDEIGRTVAVLGSGLKEIYPPENERLFYEIAEKGAVVSEFPLSTRPLAQNFPVRNRIISGLSRGILVVEANQKSGALITARFASEQSREVYAIPGKVSSQTSLGTNELIKSGAKMVTDPKEILSDLR